MQFDVPDPAYTGSVQARAHFRLAAKIAFSFIALLWVVSLTNWGLELDPEVSGIRPRQWAGLPGIVFAPLVHGGFDHLIANSAPLLVSITAMVFLYPSSGLRTLPAVWLGSGILVWLFGRESVHFGASGLVYGLASYVFVAGLLRRDRRAIAASLVVWFMYGSLVWGLLPTPFGVSWETHLAAALIGVALAIALRRLDTPPRKHYVWEGEAESDKRDLLPTAMDDLTPGASERHNPHSVMTGGFTINILNTIKAVPEVCAIYGATANPVEVIVADTGNGRGIFGVVDGVKSKAIETESDIEARKQMLRKFGYKL